MAKVKITFTSAIYSGEETVAASRAEKRLEQIKEGFLRLQDQQRNFADKAKRERNDAHLVVRIQPV